MKMTKQNMIDKVQEIKADYQQVLKHIAISKRRYRDVMTEQQANGLDKLYSQVEMDYSELCRLENEAYKPRHKKADMVFLWEDVLSYDSSLWGTFRPTLNLRIEEIKAQEEQEKTDVEKPQEETQQEEKQTCGNCTHWAGLPVTGKSDTSGLHIGHCGKWNTVAMSCTENRCKNYIPRSRVPTGDISA